MDRKLAEEYASMIRTANRNSALSPSANPGGTNSLYPSLSWADSPDLDGLTKCKSHTGDLSFKISSSARIQTDETIYTYHKIHLTTPVPDNLKPKTPSDVLAKITGKCIECTNLSALVCPHEKHEETRESSRLRLLKSQSGNKVVPVKSILVKKGNQDANIDAHFSNSVSFDTVNLKFSDDLNNYPLSSFSDSDSDDGLYRQETREGRSRKSDVSSRLAPSRSPSRSKSPGNRVLPSLDMITETGKNLQNLFDLKYPTSPIITHDACTLTRKHKLFDDLYAGRLKYAEPKLHNRVILCYVSGRRHTWVGIDWACNEFLEDGDSFIIIASVKNPGRSLSRLQGRNNEVAIEVNVTENKVRNSPEYAQAVTENILKYALSILNPNRIVKVTVELAVGSTNDVFQDMYELYQPSLTIVGVKPGKAAPTKAWATRRLTDRIVVKSPIPTIIVSPVNMALFEEKLFKVLDKRMELLNRGHANTTHEVEELLNDLDRVGIYTEKDQLEYIKKNGIDNKEVMEELASITKALASSKIADTDGSNDSTEVKSISSYNSSVFGDDETDDDETDDVVSDISVDSENPPALVISKEQTPFFKLRRFELLSQVKIYKETLKLESEPLNEDSFKRYLTVVSDSVREYGVQLAEQAKKGEEEYALVCSLTGAPEEIKKTKSMVSAITKEEEDNFNEKLKRFRQQKKLEQQQKLNSKGFNTKIPKINIVDYTDMLPTATSPVQNTASDVISSKSDIITGVPKPDAKVEKKKKRGFFGLFKR